MKITWKLLDNSVVLTYLFAGAVCIHLISWGVLFDLSKSDWGTWVGAIGTVATLVGTVVLATAASREARQQAHDRAVVAAASLGPRLQMIAKTAQNAVENFLDFSRERRPEEYLTFSGLIAEHGTWSDEEILPLIVLPDHVATRLAGARSLVEALIVEMRSLANEWGRSYVQDDLVKRQGKIAADLVAYRDIVIFAGNECKRVIESALRT